MQNAAFFDKTFFPHFSATFNWWQKKVAENDLFLWVFYRRRLERTYWLQLFFVTDQSRLLFSFWVKSSPKFCRKKCAKKCACRGDWKILKRLFPTSSSDAKCSFFWQNFFLYFQFLTFFFWKTQLFLYFYVVFCALLTSKEYLQYHCKSMVSL